MGWGEESVVVLMGRIDLGSKRLLGDNEINPKNSHQKGPRNQNQKNPKIRFCYRSHNQRESETRRIRRSGRYKIELRKRFRAVTREGFHAKKPA